MPEQSRRVTAENLLNNFMETFIDGAPKQSLSSYVESTYPKQSSSSYVDKTEKSSSVTASFDRLFGRQKPVHHLLGGGKSADVLLWRNKKISGSVLAGSTFVWLLFEWLNYHMLTLICIGLAGCMLILFVWSHSAAFLNRSPPGIRQIALPEDIFVESAIALRNEINRFLNFLQVVATGSDLKAFVMVVGGLIFFGIIASWCNFLTLLYIGSVAAHILPVLYEKYDDQVDSFIYNLLDKMMGHYRRLDSNVLKRIPSLAKGKKS